MSAFDAFQYLDAFAPKAPRNPGPASEVGQARKNQYFADQKAYEQALLEAQRKAIDTYRRRKPRKGPGDAPDLLDQAVQRARETALLGAQVGRTGAATFATKASPLSTSLALLGSF